MSIITISRPVFARGQEVAKLVAQRLGYECVAREVLHEAAQEFHVSEEGLAHAMYDSPSFFDRFTHAKERYISYVKTAFLEHMQRDNVVYYGHAGHFFLEGVSHALKVSVVTDIEVRASIAMERLGGSESKAKHLIHHRDTDINKLSQFLYHQDTWDPQHFHLVVHTTKLGIDDSVDVICRAVGREQFATTPESQRRLDDHMLACKVRAHIIDARPDAEVKASDGDVYILIHVHELHLGQAEETIQDYVSAIPGVNSVTVEAYPADYMLE
jgi:cytidylate kinase